MEDRIEKLPKKNKSKTDIIIKILTAACIISAAALLGVIVMAFLGFGGDYKSTDGNLTPDNVSGSTFMTTLPPTTEPTTLLTTEALTTNAPKQKIAYATEEVNIRSAPSTDSEILGQLSRGGMVQYVSVDAEGWVKVIYDGEVCYIHRDYLSTTKPADITDVYANNAIKTVDPTGDRWYLVVVDKNRQIPESYVPEITYTADSDCSLEVRVAPYYDAMYEAALKDGIELTPYSGFRSYETQERNYNSLVDDYINAGYSEEEAKAEAATEILPPGCSEHNLGLAMDICGTDDDFKYTEEYEWLTEHAHEYGFIERYTDEKQDITGIIPEPWHWRFVGPSHAAKIRSAGICLEEYYQYYGVEY